MTKSSLVIENAKGQVIRSVEWKSNSLAVFVNHQTGRVELTDKVDSLRHVDFPYTVLAESNRDLLSKEPMTLSKGRGTLRLVKNIDQVVDLVELKSEDPSDFAFFSKWSLISHGVLLSLLLITGFILKRFQPVEPPPLTVFQQAELPQAKIQTVRVSEKKIEKPILKAKVSHRTVKTKTKMIAKRPQVKFHKTKSIATQVSVSQMGALGALGGLSHGKKGSAGFNLNATNASLGTGLKEIGSQGAGGWSQSVHGRGLVSAPVGSGGVTGGGGYGTRGKGGGRPGYGTLSMVGGSQGISLPLEEEALVEGGLDRDQIAAVIQRNIGQILYCYEKGLQVQSGLAGRVAVRFVINPRGQVSTAQINNSSLHSASVEGCILNKLRSWNFPKPVGAVHVKVTYPFVLRRVG